MTDIVDESPIWLIEPAVDPEDESWQDRPVWAEIVVAAENPAFARLAADVALSTHDRFQTLNETARSGLNDAQLYHVRALPAERRADFPDVVKSGDLLLACQLRPGRRV